MFYKLLVGFALATTVIQAASSREVAILVVPAPQIPVDNYQPLVDRLKAKIGDGSVISMVKMPVSFNYDYDPEQEIMDELQNTNVEGKNLILIGHSWGGHAI